MEIRGRLGSGACSLSLVLICFAFLDSGLSVLADLQSLGFLFLGPC